MCNQAEAETSLRDDANKALIAAIVYQAGDPVDGLMLSVADTLRSEGVRLRGAVQRVAGDRAACSAMSLVDLASGEQVGISQALGLEAKGCRLDPRGLSDAAAKIDRAMAEADFDLLILNRFGRSEAEGGGLRHQLVRAAAMGKPVLSAVRPPYLEAWSAFHGGLAADLAPRLEAVLAWCRSAAGGR